MSDGDEDTYPALWDFEPYERTIIAIQDGTLAPLAEYLRSGHPIDDRMRNMIADHIEGSPGVDFKIYSKGKRGQAKRSDVVNKNWEDMKIGLFVLRRIKADPDIFYDAVVAEAASNFSVGKTRVKGAISVVRRTIAELNKDGIQIDPSKGEWMI